MTTLEKILQEIEAYEAEMEEFGVSALCPGWVKKIIKKNLSDNENNTKCSECSRRKFYQKGYEDGKKDNEGWIPVEEGMPETNKKVDITFREWMKYSKKYRYGTCNAVYIPKNTVKAENMWSDYENSDCVDYDEDTDTEYVLPGWYETIEHWDDYSHCYINCEVIAWRPLPEPYRPEQLETCKYTGGSCCWPIDQCSDCPNHLEGSE